MTDATPDRPRSSTRLSRLLGVAVCLALLLAATALSLQRIRSFDYWWHLETGELIAETGEVPRTDVYSYSVPGARYIDAHWVHQLGLHATYSLGGHAAVVLAKGVLVLLLLALLVSAGGRRDRPALTAFALGLALLAMSDRIMPRPELPTFVLLAAVLALLARHRRHPDAWIWAIVPIQLLWANLHGLFAVGLATLALEFAGRVADGFLPGRERMDRRALATLAGVGLASGAVCLINPNGLEGALYPLKQAAMISGRAEGIALRSIELRSPIFAWHLLQPPIIVGWLLLTAASVLSMAANFRRVRAADVAIWGAFTLLALASLRNIALFGVAAAPILIRNGGAVLDRVRPRAGVLNAATAVLTAALLGVAVAAAHPSWALRSGSLREAGLGVSERLHPVGAVEWIRTHRPKGPIYHDMGDGGYLIRHLRPDYPVLADGRLEVYGPALRELSATDPAGFRALDRRFRFGVALLGYLQFDMGELLGALYRDRAWRLAYVDETSAVFVRRRPRGGEQPDLDVRDPDLFGPAPEGAWGVDDFLARMGRARFYTAVGRRREAGLWIADLRDRYPDALVMP